MSCGHLGGISHKKLANGMTQRVDNTRGKPLSGYYLVTSFVCGAPRSQNNDLISARLEVAQKILMNSMNGLWNTQG